MYDIEALLPHRNSMKLVDEVVEIDEQRCVVAATVTPAWPLFRDGGVDSIILIELAAQTAGVHFGWEEMRKGHASAGKVGWLVGVKKAELYRDMIPEKTRITVSIEDRKSDDSYAEIVGTAVVGSETVAEIMLQVFRPENL
ncbi:MAG: hypothetical protein JW807_09030 [Spirochaetes bacterium]|nr:hypothetical protein [Spirochaetota bacterium]